jgi:hypothetical protein
VPVYFNFMLKARVLLVLLGLSMLCSVSPLQSQAKKPGGCVDVTTQASYASVGYDHIVTLKSGCKVRMACKVSTNVNPDPANVDLGPGETQSVVTWRGSPAYEFTANVTCVPSK